MEHKERRKVLFIMTDSQRADWVSCYGNPDMATPNLDQLAEEGIRFDHAYTTQPLCQPARAGLFLGCYPHSCASWTNSMGVSDNVQSIGKRLMDQGIHTAYIGKWHLDGSDYFGKGVCPEGWDPAYWYDMRNYLYELTPEERVFSRDSDNTARGLVKEEFTYAHKVADRAIDFLKNYNEDDFFLVASLDEPHEPFLCPIEYYDKFKDYKLPRPKNYDDTLEDKPEHQKIWASRARQRTMDPSFRVGPTEFLACNAYADYEIGRILEAARTYAPDAVIIYTSDHGDMMYAHSLTGKGPAAYEENIRIPLIIKGFGHRVDTNPVSHLNLAPAIMEMMGFEIPKALEGKSLLPELEDENVRVNEAIFTEYSRYEVDHDAFGGFQPLRCVFDGRYKLVVNLLSSDEFYDLETDPDEMVNLIYTEDPELQKIRNDLHMKLLDEMYRTRDPFRGYYWEDRPWHKMERTWGSRGMTRQRENEEYEPRQLVYETGLVMDEAVRKK